MKKSRVYECVFGPRDGHSRVYVHVQAQSAEEASGKLKRMMNERGLKLSEVLIVKDIGELWEEEPNP